MRATALIAMLLAACNSTLEFTVERYDLDASPDARTAYGRMHPPSVTIGQQRERLVAMRDAVGEYTVWLKALNHVAQLLMLPEGGDAKAKEKESEIDSIIQPLQDRLDAEIGRIGRLAEKHGAQQPPSSSDAEAEIERMWRSLPSELEKRGVVTDRSAIETVVEQLDAVRTSALQEHVDSVRSRLAGLATDDQGRRRLQELAESFAARPGATALACQSRVESARSVGNSASEALQRLTGDLLTRPHEPYQDMSDPYLAYLAAHPEHWKILDNKLSVSGDGDTEFLLVFENHLDGRWKNISVDPSKVIKARLQVARKVAGAVTALGGIALKAYGVPLPAGLQTGSGAGSETVDYSRMTGDTELLVGKNELLRKQIDDLRAFAISQLSLFKEADAGVIHDQLRRRLAALPQ